jgi:hypothetical protein
MKLLKSFTLTTAALILMGCAQGSGTAATPADTSTKATRVYTPTLASDLVDRSGEVQSVQGIDPRKYFVANEIALEA